MGIEECSSIFIINIPGVKWSLVNVYGLPYKFESETGIILVNVTADKSSVTIPTTELAAPGARPI